MMAARRRWTFAAACAAALVMLLAAYSNSLQNQFHFDDSHVVSENLYIRNIANLPRFFRDAATFSSVPSNSTYRPLVTATLALDYWIGGGLEPRQFHLTQLALLVLLAVMVFLLFCRLLDAAAPHAWNGYAALIAAALFALHTTATETMNLIHARSELMSVMGVVGAFLVYVSWPSLRWTHLYLVPMAVGALAKNQAVIFGPLFVAYVFLFEQRLSLADLFRSSSWPRVWRAIAQGLPALGVSVALLFWIESMNAAAASYGGGTPLAYLRTQLWVWVHYVRLFIVPAGLTADTDWTLIEQWYDTRVFVGLLLVALLARILWLSSRVQALTPVAFGIAWFILALMPASSVIGLAEVANEHRVFFPYVGLSLAVVWGLAWCLERWADTSPRLAPTLTRAAGTLAITALLGNAVGTYERNRVWRTEESLWRDVTEKSPANGRGWMNYGLTQMVQGRYDEAKRLFERALVYNPNYATLEVNLAIVKSSLGDPVGAEAHFRRALMLRPDEPSSYSYYARWLVQQNRVEQAIPLLTQAVALSPAIVDARYQLLDAYTRTGQTDQAKALAAETLALSPGDPVVERYLHSPGPPAVVQMPVPTSHDAFLEASLQRYRAGDFQGSIDAAKQALSLKPDSAEAYNNIAAGYASLRRWDDAIQAAREALRLRPDYPLARNNLAWAEAERRKAKQ